MDIITPNYVLNNNHPETINFYVHDAYSSVVLEDGTRLNTYEHWGWRSEFIEDIFETLDPHLRVDFQQKPDWNGTQIDIYCVSLDDNIYGSTVGLAVNWNSYYDVIWEPQYDLKFDQNTIIHEIGHALGLQHPDGEGFNPNYNQDDTVMSYNSGPGGWRTWFSEHDINALQSIWGIEQKVINGGTGDDTIYFDVGIKTEDYLYGHGGNDSLFAYFGPDALFGGDGEDFLHGNHGKDYLDAGRGDDIIRGGHGPDQLIGGEGEDWIWGGVGANDIWLGNYFEDGSKDEVFISVDSVNNHDFGNPGGLNRDMISGLEMHDRIFIHGAEDSQISFAEGISDPKGTWNGQGVGIFAYGTLEALITSDLSAEEIDSITTGGFFA